MGIQSIENQSCDHSCSSMQTDPFSRLSVELRCVLNFQGDCQNFNVAWAKILSCGVQELIGKNLIEWVHPEDYQLTLAAISKLTKQFPHHSDLDAPIVTFENRLCTGTNTYQPFFWKATANPQEQLIYAVVQVIDESPHTLEAEQQEERHAKLSQINTLLKQEVQKRKYAQKQLRKSEEQLRSYFDLSLIGSAISSPEKGWIEVNDALCKIFGYSREQLLTMTWVDLTYPEDLEADVNYFNRVLAGEIDHYSMNKRFIRADGEIIYANISARCIRNKDGSVDYFVAQVQDITEHIKTQEAEQRLITSLQQSESRLKLAIRAAKMGFWDWNIASGELKWSEGVEALFKQPTGSFGNNYYTFLNLVHPEDRSQVMLALARSIEAGASYNIEHRFILPNGRVCWIASSGEVVRDLTGTPLHMIATIRDVTDRKQAQADLKQINEELERKVEARTAAFRHAIGQLHTEIAERKTVEEQLRHSQEMLQQVMDNIPQLIAWKDRNSVYLGCNQNMARVVGLSSPEEIIGKIDYDLPWTTETASYFRQCDQRVMETNTPEYHMVESQRQANGKQVWFDKNRIPLHDSKGNVIGILITFEDITERQQSEARLREKTVQLEATLEELKRTQTQLIQTEKMSSLGQLVAGVAHEINNPVNFIYGNINYASQYTQDLLELIHLYQESFPNPNLAIQEKQETIDLEFIITDLPNVLKSIQLGAERIREIVLSLRTFSRHDEAEKKQVDIHEGLDSTLLILHHRLKNKRLDAGIEVIKDYGNLPLVECYAGQLNQVFMNLIANAIDALEDRPIPRVITLKTEWVQDVTKMDYPLNNAAQSLAVIHIIDNGPGMTETVKKRLFDPFFTTKPVGKGTGLGLSICYQIIVNKHSGYIQCFSKPGIGTEFVVAIPIRQSQFSPASVNLS
jgi:two-component system NtrC family sensor kinase